MIPRVFNADVLRVQNFVTDLFTIRSSGNTGIGTTTPSEKLEVEGNIRLNGNLFYTGNLVNVSDRKFKENERKLTQALEKINQLQPKTYSYIKTDLMSLPSGERNGFVAQEVQEVFPNLVSSTRIIKTKNNLNNSRTITEEEYLGVDYVSMIPVIVAAIQEQQSIINEQNEIIQSLTSELNNISLSQPTVPNSVSSTNAQLLQNEPNPFNLKTSIRYSVETGFNSGNIYIFDLQGKEKLNFELSDNGNNSVEISAGQLEPGMYIYSLVIDGNIIDSKRMILNR